MLKDRDWYKNGMTWYLKNSSTTIGLLEFDKDSKLFLMNVFEPQLFTGKITRVVFDDRMCREWFESRMTPQYQQGYVKKITEMFGLDTTDPDHRLELFVLSQGSNVKDGMWITENEEDDVEQSPYFGL